MAMILLIADLAPDSSEPESLAQFTTKHTRLETDAKMSQEQVIQMTLQRFCWNTAFTKSDAMHKAALIPHQDKNSKKNYIKKDRYLRLISRFAKDIVLGELCARRL